MCVCGHCVHTRVHVCAQESLCIRVHECECMCVCARECVFMHECEYICVWASMYVRVSVCVYVFECDQCVCALMHVCICVRVWMHVCMCVLARVCVVWHVMGWVWRSENFYPVDSRDQIQVVRLGGRDLYLTALKIIFLWECGCFSEDVKVIWTKQKWEVTFTNHVATIESLKPSRAMWVWPWLVVTHRGGAVFGSPWQLWELGGGSSACTLDGNEQGLKNGPDHWEWGEGLLPAAQTVSRWPRWPSFSVSPSSGAPLGHHFCPHRRL